MAVARVHRRAGTAATAPRRSRPRPRSRRGRLLTAVLCLCWLAGGCDTTYIGGADYARLNEPLPSTAAQATGELARLRDDLAQEQPPGAALSPSHAVACDRLTDVVQQAGRLEGALALGEEAYELVRRADGWCSDEPRTAADLLARALATTSG